MNAIVLLNQLAPSGIDFATDCSLESAAGARPTCTRVKKGFLHPSIHISLAEKPIPDVQPQSNEVLLARY